MSNVSCEDFGRVLTTDISASTVTRSEMRAAAGLVASANLFYQQMLTELKSMDKDSWTIVLHSYRQDATNGHRKLCALELESCFMIAANEQEFPGSASCDHFCHIKRLADLVQIENETGPGCVSATLNAFRSLGCPSWRDIRDMCPGLQSCPLSSSRINNRWAN